MSKQLGAECHFVINLFKATELTIKTQLDLLKKTIQLRKSFRCLSLLIDRTRNQENNFSQKLLNQQPNQITATSILSRQANLNNRLDELQSQVNLLDDDAQLIQSSSRVRDDISLVSCRGTNRDD